MQVLLAVLPLDQIRATPSRRTPDHECVDAGLVGTARDAASFERSIPSDPLELHERRPSTLVDDRFYLEDVVIDAPEEGDKSLRHRDKGQ
jgi:hypothetical protein